jgi:hypothetical protein
VAHVNRAPQRVGSLTERPPQRLRAGAFRFRATL